MCVMDGAADRANALSKRLPRRVREEEDSWKRRHGRWANDDPDAALSVKESVIRCLQNPCYVMQGILFTVVLSFIVFTMGLLFRWW